MAVETTMPRCHLPWQQTVFDATSPVPCCYSGAYGNANLPIGNLNENTVREIWSNEGFRRLRRGMAAGDLGPAGCEKCFALQQRLTLGSDYDSDRENKIPPRTAVALQALDDQFLVGWYGRDLRTGPRWRHL
jgi:hypothetical protein